MSGIKKVLIAIPCTEGIHRKVFYSLLKSLAKVDDKKIGVTFLLAEDRPIDNNRNKIIDQFLESDGEYLLFCDTDNPPEGDPLERVEDDLDIVVYPTPIFDCGEAEKRQGNWPIQWNVYDYSEEKGLWRPRGASEGLVEVDAGGTGCMLIARRVLEKIEQEAMPWFARDWSPRGTIERGSDLLFTKKAKDLGFKIWADWDCICSHYKTVNVLDLMYMTPPGFVDATNLEGAAREPSASAGPP